MGVYINMEMPKNCPCELVGIGYDMYCSFVHGIPARVKEYDECCEKGTRPDWCPAIEVPEPHGRLIDADVLPWYLANKPVKYASYEDWEKLCDAIATAPTVIPASKEAST